MASAAMTTRSRSASQPTSQPTSSSRSKATFKTRFKTTAPAASAPQGVTKSRSSRRHPPRGRTPQRSAWHRPRLEQSVQILLRRPPLRPLNSSKLRSYLRIWSQKNLSIISLDFIESSPLLVTGPSPLFGFYHHRRRDLFLGYSSSDLGRRWSSKVLFL